MLFLIFNDFSNERDDLILVIDTIYRVLDTNPDYDVELMHMWQKALGWAETTDDMRLLISLNQWERGRNLALSSDYIEAVKKYKNAINASGGNHPALFYDLALAYIELEEYDKALQQLDTILRIAQTRSVMPIPTISPTLIKSNLPTPPSTKQLNLSSNETPNLMDPVSPLASSYVRDAAISDTMTSGRSAYLFIL